MYRDKNSRANIQFYKVELGDKCVYAGEYPGDRDNEIAKKKISRLLEMGIRHFIDLTEEGELIPYSTMLPIGTTYLRFPIVDQNTPKREDSVVQLLNDIHELQKKEGGIYIHCWGGVGRTGTIIGCLIAKELNLSLEDSLKQLRKDFEAETMPKSAYRVTPENE